MVIANIITVVRDDESFERALRRFTKQCEKSGVIRDIKRHLRYDKPSVVRNRKRNLYLRKLRKEKLLRIQES